MDREDVRDHDESTASSKLSVPKPRRKVSIMDHFAVINERPVDDISLEFFYKPHTLTLLICAILLLVYTAFTRDDSNRDQNIWAGVRSLTFFFLLVSVLAFPNGPFYRPHPAIWRMVFGLSVLYLIALQFILYQNFNDVKAFLKWIDPALNKSKLDEKEYAVNCSQVTFKRIWDCVDYFAFAHFSGWAMKALLVRHYVICWYISITWELTEIVFAHLLPNFQECWWDAILLDVVLCNGLGIWVGMQVCKKLEMSEFHWESIRHIPTARGKLKRAVLQFTPASWTHVRWLDPTSSFMRVLAVWKMVIIWQVTELNTFFLKHIFAIDTENPLNMYRVFLVAVIVAPSLRQYYSYVTDPQCKRVGTQCWVFCAIMITESLICIKFGKDIFAQTQLLLIGAWIILLLIGSIICVKFAVKLAQRSGETTMQTVNGEVQHYYIDSSYENLTQLPEAAQLRRRTLRDESMCSSQSVESD